MNNENGKTNRSTSNVLTQILLSAIAAVLGYLLLFKPEIQLITLCRFLCGALIVIGIISIVMFFTSEDYKRIDRFGFAYGVMFVLLGCVGLLRVNDLTAGFELFAGMIALILGVLTLQGTVQMHALDYPVWVLNLVLSLFSLFGAFVILSKIVKIMQLVEGFPYWILLINGASCLFSMLVTSICIWLAKRRAAKAEKEKPAPAAEPEPAYPPYSAPVPGYSYNPEPAPAPAPAPSYSYNPEPAAPAADPEPVPEPSLSFGQEPDASPESSDNGSFGGTAN